MEIPALHQPTKTIARKCYSVETSVGFTQVTRKMATMAKAKITVFTVDSENKKASE